MTLAGKTATGVAGAQGKWLVRLDALPAGRSLHDDRRRPADRGGPRRAAGRHSALLGPVEHADVGGRVHECEGGDRRGHASADTGVLSAPGPGFAPAAPR